VNLEDATRQKSGQLELPLEGRGESPRAERSGEASTAAHGNERSGTDEAHLMERVVERGNVIVALKRVQKNKGSPGIDGMTVEALRDHLRETWRRRSRARRVAARRSSQSRACEYLPTLRARPLVREEVQSVVSGRSVPRQVR
jgi:hypothetical protein